MYLPTSTLSAKFTPCGDWLDIVGTRNGLTWIDDGRATHPDRTVAALEALDGPLLLIGGGRCDGQPLDEWAAKAGSRCTHVLLYGPAAQNMAAALVDYGGPAVIVRCADLDDATRAATALGQRGDTLLFSPGCAAVSPRRPTPAERFRDLATMPRAARAAA